MNDDRQQEREDRGDFLITRARRKIGKTIVGFVLGTGVIGRMLANGAISGAEHELLGHVITLWVMWKLLGVIYLMVYSAWYSTCPPLHEIVDRADARLTGVLR